MKQPQVQWSLYLRLALNVALATALLSCQGGSNSDSPYLSISVPLEQSYIIDMSTNFSCYQKTFSEGIVAFGNLKTTWTHPSASFQPVLIKLTVPENAYLEPEIYTISDGAFKSMVFKDGDTEYEMTITLTDYLRGNDEPHGTNPPRNVDYSDIPAGLGQQTASCTLAFDQIALKTANTKVNFSVKATVELYGVYRESEDSPYIQAKASTKVKLMYIAY